MKTFKEYVLTEAMSKEKIVKEMIGLDKRTKDKDGWFNYDKGGKQEEETYEELKKGRLYRRTMEPNAKRN